MQKKSVFREYVESILIAVALALIVRTYLIQAFKIPTGSMRPTLIEGDRLMVNKLIYRFKEPQAGDIIVFRYPEDPRRAFIKRLVAKPGQAVELKDGKIYIDGEVLDEPDIFSQFYYYNRAGFGAGKIVVPKDSYYVLGDNSASSRDSRYWGFVPKKFLLGKALFIYWPLDRIRILK